jgi:hypothetical protein
MFSAMVGNIARALVSVSLVCKSLLLEFTAPSAYGLVRHSGQSNIQDELCINVKPRELMLCDDGQDPCSSTSSWSLWVMREVDFIAGGADLKTRT